MAHFAQLDENSIVAQVIVINNAVIDDLPFPQSEPLGIDFCKTLYGENTSWAQTSYNANFRYNYAGIGFVFDPNVSPDGAFIPPQPYPSWILNPSTQLWEPPVPYPDDGLVYFWDEATQSWIPAT